jgi:hypothetical protein
MLTPSRLLVVFILLIAIGIIFPLQGCQLPGLELEADKSSTIIVECEPDGSTIN